MVVLLQIIALTLLLLLFQEALRRANRWVVWGLFLLLPFLLTPYWIQVNDLGLFSWFKYYTVFFCVCWGTALRCTSLGNRAWARSTISLLLAVNILEAVVLDAVGPGPAHSLNAAAGLLLIATMPYGSAAARVHATKSCRDLLYGTNRRWVIGYTLWNWTFVYLNYPALAGHHAAVLAAGLIVALIAPQLWSQTRASTLGISLLLTATCYHRMVAWMDTSAWLDSRLGILAASLSLAFITACEVHHWLPRLVQALDRRMCSPCGAWVLHSMTQSPCLIPFTPCTPPQSPRCRSSSSSSSRRTPAWRPPDQRPSSLSSKPAA